MLAMLSAILRKYYYLNINCYPHEFVRKHAYRRIISAKVWEIALCTYTFEFRVVRFLLACAERKKINGRRSSQRIKVKGSTEEGEEEEEG